MPHHPSTRGAAFAAATESPLLHLSLLIPRASIIFLQIPQQNRMSSPQSHQKNRNPHKKNEIFSSQMWRVSFHPSVKIEPEQKAPSPGRGFRIEPGSAAKSNGRPFLLKTLGPTSTQGGHTMPEEPKRYQCRHIFTDGRRCGSPSLRHEELFYYHHTPRHPVENPAERSARHAHFDLPLPEDRSAIQSAIGQVLQRIARNQL